MRSVRRARVPLALLPLLLLAPGCSDDSSTAGPDSEGNPAEDPRLDRTATQWAPYEEWTLSNPSFSGNPFDLVATATFTHEASGERRTTEMFYAGGSDWKFRFTGTRTGRWTFATASDDPELDGWTGTVTVEPVPDSAVRGFLVARGRKLARMDGNGTVEGFQLKVFADGNLEVHRRFGYGAGSPVTRFGDERFVRAYVEKALDHGANWIFFSPRNEFLRVGAVAHDQHDSEDPDLEAFRAIETAITVAHGMGAGVHLWAWGDEQRRWTPVGLPGGVNGPVDRRLQRYVAARLGPLPGWTMSYGFDLSEWVSPAEVEAWAGYLEDRMGWDHLLMARGGAYDGPSLDVQSLGGPGPAGPPEVLARMAAADRPVMEEERFLHRRRFGGVLYDMDHTIDLWWWMSMGGGMSGFWGTSFACPEGDPCPEYPRSEWMRIHAEFWEDRFRLDLEPANHLTDGLALADPGGERFVFYREGATSLTMDLSGAASGSLPAVAVDARGDAYREIDVGPLTAATRRWTAPYASDWVVAVGEF